MVRVISEFEPKDFLLFSKNILEIEDIEKVEASHRSAISRAYYSAFLFAREKIDLLDNRIIEHSRSDVHKQVARASIMFDFDLLDDFLELRDLRVDSDYRFSNAESERNRNFEQEYNPNLKEIVEHCIEMAESIISRIDSSH